MRCETSPVGIARKKAVPLSVVLQIANPTQIIGEPGGLKHSPKCTQTQTDHSTKMNVIVYLAPYFLTMLGKKLYQYVSGIHAQVRNTPCVCKCGSRSESRSSHCR